MESKPPADNRPVHIINIDIQDNHEEATMGAFLICDLVAMVGITLHFKFENISLHFLALCLYNLLLAHHNRGFG